jgi:hypothetical protein
MVLVALVDQSAKRREDCAQRMGKRGVGHDGASSDGGARGEARVFVVAVVVETGTANNNAALAQAFPYLDLDVENNKQRPADRTTIQMGS